MDRETMDLTVSRQDEIDLAVGDRVEVDPSLGKGTIVAWVEKHNVDSTLDPTEDWLLVDMDDDLWAWKGSSARTDGAQAVAFVRILVVSLSNVTSIN